MVSFPKAVEHSKQYFLNIQLFGDRLIEEDPIDLNYLVTSFEIINSGGSSFVHQKGNTIASAFAMQPTVSIRVRCLMSEPDFAVISTYVITQQQQIVITVGKMESYISINDQFNEPSALLFEAIGFMKDSNITATVGNYVSVDFSIAADEIRYLDGYDLPSFDP